MPNNNEINADSQNVSPKRMLWLLFWEFFKIASFVVGGGFAILIVAEDVFVKKYHWLRNGELSDMLALIQTVPGLTAGNIAIYTGYRIAGTAGALLALTGVTMPSFIVITTIAAGFSALPLDHYIVQGAFTGVRTAMAGLMLVVLVQLWESSLRDPLQYAVFIAGIIAVSLFHLNPGWLIGTALILGPVWCMAILRRIPKAAEEKESQK